MIVVLNICQALLRDFTLSVHPLYHVSADSPLSKSPTSFLGLLRVLTPGRALGGLGIYSGREEASQFGSKLLIIVDLNTASSWRCVSKWLIMVNDGENTWAEPFKGEVNLLPLVLLTCQHAHHSVTSLITLALAPKDTIKILWVHFVDSSANSEILKKYTINDRIILLCAYIAQQYRSYWAIGVVSLDYITNGLCTAFHTEEKWVGEPDFFDSSMQKGKFSPI